MNSVYLFDEYALITCNFREGPTKITIEDIENSEFGDFVKKQKNKPEPKSSDLLAVGDPYGYLRYSASGDLAESVGLSSSREPDGFKSIRAGHHTAKKDRRLAYPFCW